MKAKVYTVTTLYGDSSFQIAIVEFEDGRRKTVRIDGPPVKIDDEVEQTGDTTYRYTP